MLNKTLIALALAFFAAAAMAQYPAPSSRDRASGVVSRGAPATPYTALHSPEVHADRTVTLRFRAPNATQVEVVGEIMQGKGPLAMTKAEDGVWTATLGPLPPEIWTYNFRVQGIEITDPSNPAIKPVPPGFAMSNFVEVPGESPAFYDSRPVPHGEVRMVLYESKPMGSFIFLGPTGVGKTKLAKTLAWFLFDDENAVIRIDMSEYMEKFSVSRLIGAPPGYVGYEEGGQLTEKVRRRPYAVILLDEIEKAHPEVFNILLQILDEGRLTDGQGRTVNFKNTVIIMTSNIGAELLQSRGSLGFKNLTDVAYKDMKDKLMDEVKRTFRPEFLNRIDEILIFNPLSKEDINRIVDIELEPLYKRLQEQGIKLEVSQKVKSFLVEKGFDTNFGARPLKRVIQRYIQDPLSLRLLDGSLKEGAKILADLDEKGKIVFR